MANKTWVDTLVPLISKMRGELGAQDMMTVASLTGASLHGPSSLYLRLWDDEWLVSFPDGQIHGRMAVKDMAKKLHDLAATAKREDLAASVQTVLETLRVWVDSVH